VLSRVSGSTRRPASRSAECIAIGSLPAPTRSSSDPLGRFRGSIRVPRTAGLGASCPFPWILANVPSQSPQQPFAAGNGTGAHDRRLSTYSPASRLRANWIEARVTKVFARLSKSLARRRLRPNQEELRSTTQRRGRATKPFMSSLRLTIAKRSHGTFATAAST